MNIKFISYTGTFPNLCSGVLTLEIDGKEYKFGHDYRIPHSYDENGHFVYGDAENFDSFWISGGSCGLTVDFDDYIETGKWVISKDELPEQFREFSDEIDKIFNENVPYGCCGGCI